MRIFNRSHVPWLIFVVLATIAASWIYIGNFTPAAFAGRIRFAAFARAKAVGPPQRRRHTARSYFWDNRVCDFHFRHPLQCAKRVVLWRLGTLQRWMRSHIWLTLLTIPLGILHSGFRLGGPMTTLLIALYVIVMVSGIYGLALQHQTPRIMKERLPAETVFEQIPHIREQVVAAAEKMRDSFKPAPPKKLMPVRLHQVRSKL